MIKRVLDVGYRRRDQLVDNHRSVENPLIAPKLDGTQPKVVDNTPRIHSSRPSGPGYRTFVVPRPTTAFKSHRDSTALYIERISPRQVAT